MESVNRNKENACSSEIRRSQQNNKKLGCFKYGRDINNSDNAIAFFSEPLKSLDTMSKSPSHQLQNRPSPLRKKPISRSTTTSKVQQSPQPDVRDPHHIFMERFYQQVPPPRTPIRSPILNHVQGSTIVSPPLPRRISSVTRLHPMSAPYPRIPTPLTPRPPAILCPLLTMVSFASLGIYRISLPMHLMHLLDTIVLACEAHAATLPNGWWTDLYSLTKQDLALPNIPEAFAAAAAITSYIKKWMMYLWRASSLHLDWNQPHVLRYDSEHVGVEIHHDRCDITANLCLSRNTSYVGGGTFFPDASQLVRLEFGEFLLHPGSLVHGGKPIQSGTRHLMVIFANIVDK